MSVQRPQNKDAEALQKLLSQKEVTFELGILGSTAGADHGGVTVGQIATEHEFGIGVTPRPFLRNFADTKTAEIERIAADRYQAILDGMPLAQGCEQMALAFQAACQNFVSASGEGTYPANTPGTIAKKGSSVPLIDTGVLRSSITARCVKVPNG